MSKILIIDDESSIRAALRDILEYEGYTIDEAGDGDAGLKSVLKTNYDAIFCDIKMPKKDGLDFLTELKKEHPNANHHCYAWRLGADKSAFRFNDDGEPSNTAGKPIYGQIQAKDLTNVLLVVFDILEEHFWVLVD